MIRLKFDLVGVIELDEHSGEVFKFLSSELDILEEDILGFNGLLTMLIDNRLSDLVINALKWSDPSHAKFEKLMVLMSIEEPKYESFFSLDMSNVDTEMNWPIAYDAQILEEAILLADCLTEAELSKLDSVFEATEEAEWEEFLNDDAVVEGFFENLVEQLWFA